MSHWFQKHKPNPKKPDFSLRIETHPDTHLLQTLQLNESDSILILQLGAHFYAQKKTKYNRSKPVLIQDPKLCERIRQQQILPVHLEPLFSTPPAPRRLDILLDDHPPPPLNPLTGSAAQAPDLTQRLKEAMSHFIENNPDTASALKLQAPAAPQKPPPLAASLAAYGAHRSLAGVTGKNSEPRPLQELTLPVVLSALQQASENQQAHLKKAQQLKQKLEKNRRRLEEVLAELPSLEAQLNKLSQQIARFSTQLSLENLSHENLLQKTGQELADLQQQLETALTEALSLHNLLEIYSPNSRHYHESLEQLKALIGEIVEQRHQVNYFIQQQAFRELEEQRLRQLLTRRKELEQNLSELRTAIEQLERINREILRQDPLAVPEPVPALALHELSRLETELNILNSDPALKAKGLRT